MARDNYPARYLSSYEWTADYKQFGGYSAIALTKDGSRFKMLSDRAHLIEGTITRHNDQILGVRSYAPVRLRFPNVSFANRKRRDTEGLAVDEDDRMYVSIEGDNRILRQISGDTWADVPGNAAFSKLPDNRGLEALAVSASGTIIAIAEFSENLRAPFPLYRYSDDKGWDVPHHISRSLGYVPVGADFDAQGRLYVLERGFAGFGFFSQVRRFELTGDDTLTGETLLRTKPRRHDNLEGLAVWQTETGELRLTMVSDDNFNRFQKTEIVEYALSN